MSRPLSDESVFRAIAHPARREVLEQLRAGERSAGELKVSKGTSRPVLSGHLNILRSAGLVVSRREGASIYYKLNRAGLQPLLDWAGRFRR